MSHSGTMDPINDPVVILFETHFLNFVCSLQIYGISAYFHILTSRSNVVDTIIGKRVSQFVQTRWSSRSKIINLVVDKWKEFQYVIEVIKNDSNSSSESVCGAS